MSRYIVPAAVGKSGLFYNPNWNRPPEETPQVVTQAKLLKYYDLGKYSNLAVLPTGVFEDVLIVRWGLHASCPRANNRVNLEFKLYVDGNACPSLVNANAIYLINTEQGGSPSAWEAAHSSECRFKLSDVNDFTAEEVTLDKAANHVFSVEVMGSTALDNVFSDKWISIFGI